MNLIKPELQKDYPLSFGQQSLWFLYSLNPQAGGYNGNYTWRINSKIDIPALISAIRLLSKRHPLMRTFFDTSEGRLIHKHFDSSKTDCQRIDASTWTNSTIHRFIEKETYKAFNLEKETPFRWSILAIDNQNFILSLTTHHISSDLWSVMIIFNELKELYSGIINFRESTLLKISKSYSRFVNWQQDYIQSERSVHDWNHWRTTLHHELPILDFPLDHPKSLEISFKTDSQYFDLDTETIRKIQKMSMKEGITPFVLLFVVYQVFLYRYTGQEDIIVGTPVAGRSRKDFGGVIGYFVNMVPIRAKPKANQTLRAFLKQTLEVIKNAREHQDFPFSVMVERLQPSRESNKSPIFQTIFSWEDSNSFENIQDPIVSCLSNNNEIWDLDEFSMELLQKKVATEYDIALRVSAYKNNLRIHFDYNPELLKKSTIDRMISNFKLLLDSVLANPELSLNTLPIISNSEKEILLTKWCGSTTEYPSNENIVSLFERQAHQACEKTALVFNSISSSYGILNGQANQIGHYLVNLISGRKEKIAICLERSADMISGILGILKTGNPYVPIDPSLPKERIGYIIRDTQSTIVVTHSRFAEIFDDMDIRIFYLDKLKEELFHYPRKNLNISISPDDLTYVMYTSGSTGSPKGVCITHRNVIRLVRNTNYIRFSPEDRILQFAPFSFDASTLELWGSLLNGAQLFIFPPLLPSLDDLADFIHSNKITILWLTAGLFNQVVENGLEKYQNVKQLLVGGDVLSANHIRLALRDLPDTRIINGYGPTENTTFTCCYHIKDESCFGSSIPIGKPISNTFTYILDKHMGLVPMGVTGELCIGGDGLSRGYLNLPELTERKFVCNPFTSDPNGKLYRTGDLVRFLDDGIIEFLGRIDDQVKIRGFRIELGEIEVSLQRLDHIKDAAVVVQTGESGNKQLIAYYLEENNSNVSVDSIKQGLRKILPNYMIPSAFVKMESFPITHNGKLDRKRLPCPDIQKTQNTERWVEAESSVELILREIWCSVLQLSRIGVEDNFFDLGGNSILLLQVHSKLPGNIKQKVKIVDLFEYPTIHSLAKFVYSESARNSSPSLFQNRSQYSYQEVKIAIIGMSGRFPGASSIEELWQNLVNGVETITHFKDEELLAAGLSRDIIDQPNYVKSKGILKNADLFDSHFFGFSPKQADLTDPQHRIFLECSWEALENAGYDPARYPGVIGVFGGTGYNSYRDGLVEFQTGLNSTGDFPVMIGNEKDFLCTRVAYKLNLKGPAVVNQSACSTSLVAVHSACQALKNNECDMALAGGVSIIGSNQEGYLFQKGGILSPDGHCRPFDALSQGTVPGQGVGLVVLKRLDDALEDRDTIHAVLTGSAVNNDGSLKAGYTAPGVDGQVKVIRAALDNAGVTPSSISYIEAHGTGTTLGDPIEIRALSKAYGVETEQRQFCALGTAKSNLGHLDVAAGITGLIKTVLSIKHKQLPPIVNYKSPNPAINFEESPFYLTDRLMDWDPGENPLRAGVSSFGIGGTNAHVIVEEPPKHEAKDCPEGWQILPVSAKTTTALKKACDNLLHFLEKSSARDDCRLSDIAYTLQTGRQEFQHRCIITCKSREGAIHTLKAQEPGKITFSSTTASGRPVAFMFPGQGSQYVDMAKELYLKEPVFKREMDACFDFLLRQENLDIKSMVFPAEKEIKPARLEINETLYTQPILFSIEYALAKFWIAHGVKPQSMIGHSIGEYTAACISGVFSLDDALMLVCKRGRLIQSLPQGDMLSVRTSEEEILPLLDDRLSLAAVNTPNRCVVSGEVGAIAVLKNRLENMNRDCSILYTSHAFHSHMLDPMLEEFHEYISGLTFCAPQIPYISNVTGEWIRKEQAMDPGYWVSHLRETVRFSKGVKQLMKNPDIVFLEVGPGRVLRTLSAQNLEKAKAHVVVSSVCPPSSRHSDLEYILSSLGRLWLHGVKIDWNKLSGQDKRYKIPLPTYPFERRRHWLEARERPRPSLEKIPSIGDWFYLPTWKQSYHKDRFSDKLELTYAMQWLIFIDQKGLGLEMADILRSHDQRVIEVGIGTEYRQIDSEKFEINPKKRSDFEQLVETLEGQGFMPQKIIHMWNVIGAEYWGMDYFNYLQTIGLCSIIYLLQVFVQKKIKQLMQLQIVTDNAQEIQGNEPLSPGKSTLIALVNGIQQEYPQIYCQNVDVVITEVESKEKTHLIFRLIKEINSYSQDQFIAYRKENRWVQAFEKRYLEPLSQNAIQLKEGGVYIITGGLGKIGLIIAEYLAKKVRAKIALIGRSSFPSHGEWQPWRENNESSDEISVKIERLMQLERIGSRLLVLQADISDFEQTKEAVDTIEKTFGVVNGIFHAAGEIGQNTFSRIDKITPEILEKQYKPKVQGAFVLEQLFKEKPLSFVMMFSSLSTVTGGIGYTAYAAANLFLDSFARLLDRYSPIRWITVNWDGWKTENNLDLHFLITPEEGEEVLNRILSQSFITQLVISTIDLFGRLNQIRSRQIRPSIEREPTTHTSPAITSLEQEEKYVVPRNDIEHLITKIWEEFLGIERISIHDDFFEIGGDSLMAVRLTARLEESFPGAINEKTILQESTVADLALAIQNNLESQTKDSKEQRLSGYQSLVRIQKGNDSKSPLYLVHTGLGFVYYYIDLAKSLGREQPVYAFQARGIKKGTEPITSVEDMAAFYIDELLDFKPYGTYALGGSSAGGFIAFEMAKQLQEKGHQISLLAMIDTPGPVSELPRPIRDNVEMISRMFGEKLNLDDSDSELHDMPLDLLIRFVVDRINSNSESSDLTYDFVESCIRVARVLEKAMFNYRPIPYSGNILFFKHSEPLDEFSHFPERPWIELAEQGVHVIKAPGNHYSMNMSPNVSFIANQIMQRMG
ncbi:amino acid adenylation domain-containing protein [bacterium]|nr:amino acid adenylation domain-containing protein [bacterium]